MTGALFLFNGQLNKNFRALSADRTHSACVIGSSVAVKDITFVQATWNDCIATESIINCFHYIVMPVILIISRTDPNKGSNLYKSMHLEHIIKISKF